MGSVHQHGTGYRWHWRDAAGKTRRSPTQPTPEAASAWGKRHAPAQDVETIGQLADLWRDKRPTPYRKEAARRVVAATVALGLSRLRDLTLAAFEDWGDAGASKAQVMLLGMLRWGARVHHLPISADVLAWKPPSAETKPKRPLLTDAMLDDIRAAAALYGERALAVVDYLASYGARPITACQLTVADLDVSRVSLTIRRAKHSGGWTHPVAARHITRWSMLSRWETPGADNSALPLFPHYKEDRAWRIDDGRANELATWYRKTVARRAKLPPTCNRIYDLKRAAITTMLRRGITPATVASFTGHKNLEQVLTYATTGEELAREALDRLRLDDVAVPKAVPKFPAKVM